MRLSIIYALLLISSTSLAQTFPVPIVIFDSMVFEIRKGRSCDSLQAIRATRIKDQGEQLINQDKALRLAESFGEAKDAETIELRSAMRKQEEVHKIDLKIQRKKSFKKGIGVGVGLFVLVEVGKMVLGR